MLTLYTTVSPDKHPVPQVQLLFGPALIRQTGFEELLGLFEIRRSARIVRAIKLLPTLSI